MTSRDPLDERRRNPRLDPGKLAVALRPRGRLGAISAEAVDFNRHGVAVRTGTPLVKDQTVFVSLRQGDLRLDNLVGVVHNCVRQGDKFRSGILFRTSSELQHDKAHVEVMLARLESSLLVGDQQNA